MSNVHIVNQYPHSPEKVWRALTDPEIVPLRTSTGKGGRPEGFSTVVGTRFEYVAKSTSHSTIPLQLRPRSRLVYPAGGAAQ